MRMLKVATTRPMAPVVRSASRMEIALLMTVFPSSSVHSSRLPCLRTAPVQACQSCTSVCYFSSPRATLLVKSRTVHRSHAAFSPGSLALQKLVQQRPGHRGHHET